MVNSQLSIGAAGAAAAAAAAAGWSPNQSWNLSNSGLSFDLQSSSADSTKGTSITILNYAQGCTLSVAALGDQKCLGQKSNVFMLISARCMQRPSIYAQRVLGVFQGIILVTDNQYCVSSLAKHRKRVEHIGGNRKQTV